MNSKIEELKSRLGFGARTNKYRIILSGVSSDPSIVDMNLIDTFAKTTNIPGKSFNDIQVWVQGRLLTVAGKSDHSGVWTITFMDTQEHTLRGQLINWMDFIDDAIKDERDASSHLGYMSTGVLQQLNSSTNEPTAEYTHYNVYPKSLSESTFADTSADELIEFNAEFNYSYWEKTI